MPTTVILSDIQREGSLSGLWGRYNLGAAYQDGVHYGLGRMACPEGSVWSESQGKCVCRSGRVWTPDNSKCVSPQSYLITGGGTMTGGTGATFSQQKLSDRARRYIEQTGHTIRCKIDDRWASGPQGGDPSRVCSIDGGPYKYGAYAINANPRSLITSLARSEAIKKLREQGVDTNSAEGSIAVSNLTNAIDSGVTAQFVAQHGGSGPTPSVTAPDIVASPRPTAPEPTPAQGSPEGGGVFVSDREYPLFGGAGPAVGATDGLLDASISLGGSDIPIWLIAVAAAGAAYMMANKR